MDLPRVEIVEAVTAICRGADNLEGRRCLLLGRRFRIGGRCSVSIGSWVGPYWCVPSELSGHEIYHTGLVTAHWSTILVDQRVSLIGQLIDVIDQQVSRLVNKAMLAFGSSRLANRWPIHQFWPIDKQIFFILPKLFFQLNSTSPIVPIALRDYQCTEVVRLLVIFLAKFPH